MDKVRLGIVGIGGMGSGHAGYLIAGEVPNCELTAVCDINPERLEWARQRCGEQVRRFAKPEELIASGACDAILIATPHYDHPPIAIAAFEQGLHVLTEKPAGVYTRQVREMNEAAEASGKVFGIMYQLRTVPVYQKMRELVQAGELGRIMRTNWLITAWFRSQSYYDSGGWRATWAGEGGGVLMNQCPHNLDLWQWICGMPKRVRAFCYFGKYHNIEVEDDVTAYVEYENGATGCFIASTGECPGANRLQVDGDFGSMVVRNGELSWERTRESVSDFRANFPGGFGQPEIWDTKVPVRGQNTGHKDITCNFVNAILEGTPLLAPGIDGINGLSLCNAMLLSAWTGDWVDLPVPEDLYYSELQERIASSTFKKEVKGTVMDLSASYLK